MTTWEQEMVRHAEMWASELCARVDKQYNIMGTFLVGAERFVKSGRAFYAVVLGMPEDEEDEHATAVVSLVKYSIGSGTFRVLTKPEIRDFGLYGGNGVHFCIDSLADDAGYRYTGDYLIPKNGTN